MKAHYKLSDSTVSVTQQHTWNCIPMVCLDETSYPLTLVLSVNPPESKNIFYPGSLWPFYLLWSHTAPERAPLPPVMHTSCLGPKQKQKYKQISSISVSLHLHRSQPTTVPHCLSNCTEGNRGEWKGIELNSKMNSAPTLLKLCYLKEEA